MNSSSKDIIIQAITKSIQILILIIVLAVIWLTITWIEVNTHILQNTFFNNEKLNNIDSLSKNKHHISDYWVAPKELPNNQIKYGKELIAHTALYLGPKGSVGQISNGMNCQNCHLDAGTKLYGNNYGSVASTYPKFRARSGTTETIEKRINDCFERSLNGQPLDTHSNEMQAMVAYMKWLGKDVEKNTIAKGSGIMDLPYLERAASPQQGKILYEQQCASCHKKDGRGEQHPNGKEWTYPPLWGEKSYNQGAGLYRISRLAGYIKYNMPLGVKYPESILTDDDAWDIAAYINSMPHPQKDLSKDWSDASKKPIDHPFGIFTDGFNEQQHKYGPFKPIEEKRKKLRTNK